MKQKRPVKKAKETHACSARDVALQQAKPAKQTSKRDLFIQQKRPIHAAKETYSSSKRDQLSYLLALRENRVKALGSLDQGGVVSMDYLHIIIVILISIKSSLLFLLVSHHHREHLHVAHSSFA